MTRRRPTRTQTGAAAIAGAIGATTLLGVRRRLRRKAVVVPVVARTDSEPSPPESSIPTLPPALPSGNGASAPSVPETGLSTGLGDVYREARRAFGRAAADPGAETFAELLPQSGALWYALTFAEPFAGRQTKRLARETRRLSNALHEHADLIAMVTAAHDATPPLGPAELDRLDAFVAERREQLEGRVVKRGRALFETKPTRLARKLADEQATDQR